MPRGKCDTIANAVGDVYDKALVMSNQTQRLPSGQSSGHQPSQSSGKRRGWVDHSNPFSGQLVGGCFG